MSVFNATHQGTNSLSEETIYQTFFRLRGEFLQNYAGSEEQRSLIESKFREIALVIQEINRGLEYSESVEHSSVSDEILHLLENRRQTELGLEQSRTLHQRKVRQLQSEIELLNNQNLETTRKIKEIDRQLRGDTPSIQKSPDEQSPGCPCSNCILC